MLLQRKSNALRRLVAGCLSLTIVSWFGASVLAAEADTSKDTRALLTIRLQAAGRDSLEWKAQMADGLARSDFCARCHGQDGTSVMPLVPNLAGQNPYYLLDQIEQFADGRRKDFIMSPLARQFSQQDKVALAFYYANMTPRVQARAQVADPDRARQGGALYLQRCVGCHGQDAYGSDKFARLAGQHPDYLKQRLTGFREVGGNNYSIMVGIAKSLSENDITALTSYLASLR
jgi:cytochrome c553